MDTYNEMERIRVAIIEGREQRRQRHAHYLELTFISGLIRRQWIREYLAEKAIGQVIRRTGNQLRSVRLWWCRDDYRLQDPPLLDYCRFGVVFRKIAWLATEDACCWCLSPKPLYHRIN